MKLAEYLSIEIIRLFVYKSYSSLNICFRVKGGDLASMLSFQEQEEVFSIIHSGPNCPEGRKIF